ncbi:FitA-like ribbon-helix-helix domain-containing protein, partial [Pseudomonas koreensis]|uniref:FitA-like ribbon-helix-helix domain-containing protein n=1 Tax=Pseudomonas koreensis TaxID=198620 RepID=UPI0020C6375B
SSYKGSIKWRYNLKTKIRKPSGSLAASMAVSLEYIVASLTISNLDLQLYEELQLAADINNRSIEEHARVMLQKALEQNQSAAGLGTRIHRRFNNVGDVELDVPSR